MNKIIFHTEYQSESELTVAVIVRSGLNDHAQTGLLHSVGNKGNNLVYIYIFLRVLCCLEICRTSAFAIFCKLSL